MKEYSAFFEDNFGHCRSGVLPAFSGQTPRMLPNNPQCIGEPAAAEAQDVESARIEQPCIIATPAKVYGMFSYSL